MTIHNCNCANNKSGLCYGNTTEAWHRQISEKRANDGANNALVETNCPGYIAFGGTRYPGVSQGPGGVVPPFTGM